MTLTNQIYITIIIVLMVYVAISAFLSKLFDESWSYINLLISITALGGFGIYYGLAMVWGWY